MDIAREFQSRYVDTGIMRGATVVVCRRDGVVYSRCLGAHTEDTVYEGCSLTKIITAVACLQLQEAGLLTLDSKVAELLPCFRGRRRAAPGVEEASSDVMTIRQCLNHTAGFTYLNGCHPRGLRKPVEAAEAGRLKPREDLQKHVEDFMAKTALLFSPGSHFNYADGANVVARIVERVSGQDFADYIRDHITRPLGMDRTRFEPGRDNVWGDTGIEGPVADWIKLNRMLLGRGALGSTRVLSEASVQLLCANTLPGDAELVGPFAVDAAATAAPDGTLFTNASVGRTDELSAALSHYTKSKTSVGRRFGVDPYEVKACRPANSCKGHGFGLGLAVVTDPRRAGLHPKAKGTCWWQGIMSTFFAFNCSTDIGCLVMAQDMTCFTRQQALGDIINMAHEIWAS